MKPSDILESQLKKKELEYNLIQNVFEKGEIITSLNALNINSKSEVNKNSSKKRLTTPKDVLEKIEKEKAKREEREKIKLLEKLGAQVLGKKTIAQLPPLLSNRCETNMNKSKKLLDNLDSVKEENFEKKLVDKNILDRKGKLEKIVIESNNNKINSSCNLKLVYDDENLDKEYMMSISQEKRKFFKFKATELYDFLGSINLVRFIECFLEDGIEDLESIKGKNNYMHIVFIKNTFIYSK